MYLTPKDIEKFDDEEVYEYFNELFPEGAEISAIFKHQTVEKWLLHWVRENFSLTQEEMTEYCKACKLENVSGHWDSDNVQNSCRVVGSSMVFSSTGVFDSVEVSNSKDVVDCEEVTSSSQIFDSTMVENSTRIFEAQNVVDGKNIIKSSGVIKSSNIIQSQGVFESSEIVSCSNVVHSHFCKKATNLKNCLFCFGINNVEYYIFNQPVERIWYEQILKQYEKYSELDLLFVKKWPSEICGYDYPSVDKREWQWYSNFPSRFWKWVRTLPGYDEMFLYEMTMLPEILVD